MFEVDDQLDNETADVVETDDKILCDRCRNLVTRGRWRLVMKGDHEHTVFNPHDTLFRVVCFRESPGVVDRSDPSSEFSWFKGYDWVIVGCTGCNQHLGWRFQGDGEPSVFFGLVKTRLVVA